MATSKDLTIPTLVAWAMRKGIHVLGSGDFTHPQWQTELRQYLCRDDSNGLYKLTDSTLRQLQLPISTSPIFCLQTEISCVYKRDGKTRRVHNIVFMPDMNTAERFSHRLQNFGNITSDGRPVLSIDSRDLLEIALEISPDAVLIPAHVWTPWYSIFGAKSGFDSIEECFADLSPHIFALETGLSSDPAMNRLCSQLDAFALISNSDAHSGPKLGREANLFQGTPSYHNIFNALRAAAKRKSSPDSPCRFLGTCEFYPQEGKYHYDGHRACNISLGPEESRALGNKCPVCGKPLTMGVLHRVEDLADRKQPPRLPYEPEARMLLPLPEIIAQILQCGPSTLKVKKQYAKAVNSLGSELDILCALNLNDISCFWEPLGEAIARMRKGQVHIQPGFDGKYGTINIFTPDELDNR